jgi:hypothetical protein
VLHGGAAGDATWAEALAPACHKQIRQQSAIEEPRAKVMRGGEQRCVDVADLEMFLQKTGRRLAKIKAESKLQKILHGSLEEGSQLPRYNHCQLCLTKERFAAKNQHFCCCSESFLLKWTSFQDRDRRQTIHTTWLYRLTGSAVKAITVREPEKKMEFHPCVMEYMKMEMRAFIEKLKKNGKKKIPLYQFSIFHIFMTRHTDEIPLFSDSLR